MAAAREGITLKALPADRFRLPAILLSYSDQRVEHETEEFRLAYFGDSEEENTMRGYFAEVSYGQFEIVGEVYGPYTLNTAFDSTDDIVLPALELADPHVDFSLYDNDGPDGVSNSGDDDGYADAVMFVKPGSTYDGNIGGIMTRLREEFTTGDPAAAGGCIKVRTITIVPEGKHGGEIDIGIACHEFCHVLGVPDFHDYTSRSFGTGRWCLMSCSDYASARGPVHLSAWCKMKLGWLSPRAIDTESTVILNPVATSPDAALVWEDGYSMSRYFLLTYRSRIGCDAAAPGHGLLIWHVDEHCWAGAINESSAGMGPRNNDFTHKLVDLEEADGREDMDHLRNPGDEGDPFPGSSGNTSFNGNSNPSSRDYDGNRTGVAIENISRSGLNYRADITPREPVGYGIVYDHGGLSGWSWKAVEGGQAPTGGVLFRAEGAGVLSALDVGISQYTEKLEIKVYRSLSDGVPEGLLCMQSFSDLEAGWRTLKLENQSIRLKAGEEIFVTFTSDWGINFDPYSQPLGRSFIAVDGDIFNSLTEKIEGNLNLRARIRTKPWDSGRVYTDFDMDGTEDLNDALALLLHIHNLGNPLAADFNRDGSANVIDVIELLLHIRLSSKGSK